MHVSAKADYALRALLLMTHRHPAPVTMSEVVAQQALPRSFAETILPALRRAGFLRVDRVGQPSYTLTRPPAEVTVGSVLRAVDGPLTLVRGLPPDLLTYTGPAEPLSALWADAEAQLEALLDGVTLLDIVSGQHKPAEQNRCYFDTGHGRMGAAAQQ